MISRVFKKNTNGPVIGGNGGGSKKWFSGGKEVSCSSAVSGSLPPLLDSSLYASATSAYTAGEQETTFSYDSNAVSSKEHVPCFSTSSTTTTNFGGHCPTLFDFPPPQPLTSAFPSLRTLQENLQLPFYYSSMAPPPPPPMHAGGGDISSSGNYFSGENWLSSSDNNNSSSKLGPTELDCIWSF